FCGEKARGIKSPRCQICFLGTPLHRIGSERFAGHEAIRGKPGSRGRAWDKMARKETTMEKPEDSAAITPELLAEMQAACQRAMKGSRDPEAIRVACERMDRMREETYRMHGLLDIAVPTIRALRDGEDE